MTRIVFFALLAITGCSAAAAQSGCHRDADCTLVDVCGCECHAALGPPVPPGACSEACPGNACTGHHAVCSSGTCVMR